VTQLGYPLWFIQVRLRRYAVYGPLRPFSFRGSVDSEPFSAWLTSGSDKGGFFLISYRKSRCHHL